MLNKKWEKAFSKKQTKALKRAYKEVFGDVKKHLVLFETGKDTGVDGITVNQMKEFFSLSRESDLENDLEKAFKDLSTWQQISDYKGGFEMILAGKRDPKHLHVFEKKIWKGITEDEKYKLTEIFLDLKKFKFYSPYFHLHGQECHLESDVSDDTVGISPKQVKKLGVDFIAEFKKTGDFAISKNPYIFPREDGFYNWQELAKKASDNFPAFKKNVFEPSIKKAGLNTTEAFWKSTASDIISLIENLSSLSKEEIGLAVNKETINSPGEVDLNKILETKKAAWKKAVRFIPKDESLLKNVHPKNFTREALKRIEEMFGTRDFQKMKVEDKEIAISLLSNLGPNMELVKNDDILKEYGEKAKAAWKEVADVRKTLNRIEVANQQDVFIISSFAKSIEETPGLLKLAKSDSSDIDFIRFLVNINQEQTLSMFKDKEKHLVGFYRFMKNSKYPVDLSDLHDLAYLFNNASDDLEIPVVSGKVGNYTYEMLTHDDPRGLIAGYATDCCQVIGGAGESCLRHAYEYGNGTIFIVSKKDKIYAQSWVWMEDGILVFDSIEILGREAGEYSPDILECYKEASRELIKDGVDVVLAGSDGDKIPSELSQLESLDIHDYLDHDIVEQGYANYTDASSVVVLAS